MSPDLANTRRAGSTSSDRSAKARQRQTRLVMSVAPFVARQEWLVPVLNRAFAPFNPFDPARATDPYPLYRRLRDRGPVFDHRRAQIWLVSGYAATEEVLRGPVSVDRQDLMDFGPYRKLPSQVLQTFLDSMLMRDPPDHTRLRRLVSRAFTPRTVAELEPRLIDLADQMVRDLQPGDDLASTVADQFPVWAICELLGLAPSQRDELKLLSDEIAKFVDPINGFKADAMTRSVTRLRQMIDDAIADPAPGSLIEGLVAAQEADDRLDGDEVFSMVVLLLVAGHETTSGLIANALVALHDRPEQRALFAEMNDEARAGAVEELLRFDSPVQTTTRMIDTPDGKPLAIGDVEIASGEQVLVLLGAANRDPERFERPDELDLSRPDARPISFGHGIHHCLGAALARLEGKVALDALIGRFPDYRLDREAITWKRSVTLRGARTLRFTP